MASFPHAVPVVVPDTGLGERLTRMEAWAADRVGASGYVVQSGDETIAFRFRDQQVAADFAVTFGLKVGPG